MEPNETRDTARLLSEMLEDQKKLLRRANIAFYCMLTLIAVLLIAVLVLAPRAFALLEHMETSLQEVDQVVDSANSLLADNTQAVTEAVEKINAIDFEGLGDGINTLVTDADRLVSDNTQAVTEAVEKINNVDFEALNKAIRDLAAVVEPLAKLRNVFG